MAQERERLCGRGQRISDYSHDRFGQEDRTETTTKKCNTEKKLKKSKKRICSEVTVKVWGIMYSVLKKKKKGCSEKDLQQKKSLE